MKRFLSLLLMLSLLATTALLAVGCGETPPANANTGDTNGGDTSTGGDGEGDDAPVHYTNEEILVEIARAYDRKGAQILYDQNYARRSIFSSPEDATAQRTIFLDCSSFVNACYREAFDEDILPNGKSPTTENFNAYARDFTNNEDVFGYYNPSDYIELDDRKALTDELYTALEVGDVLVYRHGAQGSSSVRGHAYIYIGDGMFMHCAGAGSYVRNEKDPSLSYDSASYEIESEGTIGTATFAEIFEDTASKRYLFKFERDDTVYSFGILRPLARELEPTDEALSRMRIAGLSMEKTASVCENASLDVGSLLTYTITLKNTNEYALNGVLVEDRLPYGCEHVSGVLTPSGSSGWFSVSVDVPANATVILSHTVRVTASAPALIVSENTYVGDVELGYITHTVSAYSAAEREALRNLALTYADGDGSWEDTLTMIKAIYDAPLFDHTDIGAALDDLIDVKNRTRHTETELSQMLVPNMYGGYLIRYGWLYSPEENDKTRLPKEEHLAIGDIILADYEGGEIAYLYIGNHTLLTVVDGECRTLTIGENIYTPGENILISLLAYDRYAVLRPSMLPIE